MSTSAIEVIRKVWNHEEGICIVIEECVNDEDLLQIKTEDKDSKKWFGDFSFVISPDYAKKLGQALIDAAKEKGA